MSWHAILSCITICPLSPKEAKGPPESNVEERTLMDTGPIPHKITADWGDTKDLVLLGREICCQMKKPHTTQASYSPSNYKVLPHTTYNRGPISHQITPGRGDTKDAGEEVGSTLVHCWEVGGPGLGSPPVCVGGRNHKDLIWWLLLYFFISINPKRERQSWGKKSDKSHISPQIQATIGQGINLVF